MSGHGLSALLSELFDFRTRNLGDLRQALRNEGRLDEIHLCILLNMVPLVRRPARYHSLP